MERSSIASEARFDAYVEKLVEVIGHADRVRPLRDYCTGLLTPIARKSVEPIAAATDPARASAQHQSLMHFVSQAPWSDEAVLAKVAELALPAIEAKGPIRAWMIDDTGIPKKGKHSVGVARQYCGQLGKQDNCQVAVTLSVGNDAASLPVAHRLYLPEAWADDPARRAKAGVPDEVVFKTKPEIALDQITAAKAAGVPEGVVLGDAGYGNNAAFRDGVTALGLPYAMGVLSTTSVWPPGCGPLPPKPRSRRGRPATRLRRDEAHRPVSAKALAESLPETAWKTVTWREGTNTALTSRFAAVRVRPAHRDGKRSEPRPVEWLLIEWPPNSSQGEDEPTKYWLSTLPEDAGLPALVDLAKLRWRIERDYRELKQEIGLGHFEGRGWRGFHHHATLAIAAYGFLIAERAAIPPSGPRSAGNRQTAPLPRRRGSPPPAAPSRASRSRLDRHDAPSSDRRDRASASTMSMLPAPKPQGQIG
jgi:SRSO17 transposase